MDWKSVGFDWNRARAFLITAEEGSYSAAAKALGTTQSTLSRQVAALEDELGVSLFQRVGKGVEITPSGIELIEFVRQMAEAANSFSIRATGQSSQIEGSVTITASEAISNFVLPSLVQKLHQQEPGINIEILSTNASSDLRRREADIAVRNFQPNHPDLIAKKISSTHAYLYATPKYLKSIGHPKTVSEFSNAQFIGFSDTTRYLQALTAVGLQLDKRNFSYKSESHLVLWALTLSGAGIGVMIDSVGDNEPRVKRILPGIEPFPQVESWIVSHKELKTSPRIRYVFDFLVAELDDYIVRKNRD